MASIGDAAKPRLVVVTGLSGAGRSTALRALADLGYYCVDNLPPLAFEPALLACAKERVQNVALGIDVRVRSFLADAIGAIEKVREHYDFTLLFLDASDAVLLSRFSSTRRPHPLRTLGDSASERSLAVVDGIKLERERLSPLRASASLVVDTSSLTVHDLRRRVIELFRPEAVGLKRMVTRFVSFGFKYGAPGDCDMLLDVRFIANPYFVPELRPLSGREAAVAQFVREKAPAEDFAVRISELLRTLIPLYEEEGKSYLTVGFGCTGGRHRSVAMAEWVADRLRAEEPRSVQVVHRDVERVEAEERAERALLAEASSDGPAANSEA